jgi:hypothetical protein
MTIDGLATLQDIFSFRLKIDQTKFNPDARYLLVTVPHGVVPLGSIMGGAQVWIILPPPLFLIMLTSLLVWEVCVNVD